jgi:8-oxo-dGTP diphosphatase
MSPGASSPQIVVAAVIARPDSHLLLTRRRPGTHLGGLWEFPGGRVEDGERPEAALARELAEELAIEAEILDPLTFACHYDSEREVVLLFYRAAIRAGVPHGCEGQEVAWVPLAELAGLAMPPADAGLVSLLVREGAAGQPR